MDLLRKIKRHIRLKRIKKNYSVGNNVFLGNGFAIDNRTGRSDKCLIIGDNCIIDGTFIFERTSGSVRVGSNCHIGGSVFISINSIELEDDVTIAWGCTFYDHNSHPVDWEERKHDTEREVTNMVKGQDPLADKDWSHVVSKPIKICSKAWIGMNCIILKGVTIGEGAVVGAGSVVSKDVEPWTVVAGNPAQVIKRLK